MTESTTSKGRAAFDRLLTLQDEDSAIDALEHRKTTLPARVELADYERALARIDARERDAITARQGHEARLSDLANEVAEIVARASRIDERLRGGEAASFRDQEAMAIEMGNLDHLRRDLDDEQILVMEAIEPLETELSSLADSRSSEGAAVARIRDQLSVAESEIDAEIASHRLRRDEVAATIPDVLRADYERLRARLGGVGAARVIGGMCSGCHLTISASELDHLRHAGDDEIVHCEQCGRILVL